MRLGTARGRATKPSLKVRRLRRARRRPRVDHLFYEAGLDYVSCSPYRVPVARLAAAQAVVAAGHHDAPAKTAKAAKQPPKKKAAAR